jgi:hypothetical protein
MSIGIRVFGIGMFLLAMGTLVLGWRHQRTSATLLPGDPNAGLEGGI